MAVTALGCAMCGTVFPATQKDIEHALTNRLTMFCSFECKVKWEERGAAERMLQTAEEQRLSDES